MTFPTVRWSKPAFRATEFSVFGMVVVCYSREGIRCLNAMSGDTLWSDSNDHGDGVAPADDTRLFVARRPGTSVPMDRAPQRALDEIEVATGAVLRTIPTDLSPVSHHPVGLLCRKLDGFGGTRTSLALIDEVRGATQWREEGLGAAAFQWDITVDDPVVVAARGAGVEGRHLADGGLLWRNELQDLGGVLWPWRPANGDGVLICTAERGTAALDTSTGRLLWSEDARARASVHDGRAYLIDGNSRLSVRVARTGKLLIHHDLARGAAHARGESSSPFCTAPLIRGGAVVLADQAGWLWMFDIDSGRSLGRVQPRRGAWLTGRAILSQDCLIVADQGLDDSPSTIYCFG